MLLVHKPETYVLNFSFKTIQYFLRILTNTKNADVINVRFILGQRLGITIVGLEEASSQGSHLRFCVGVLNEQTM